MRTRGDTDARQLVVALQRPLQLHAGRAREGEVLVVGLRVVRQRLAIRSHYVRTAPAQLLGATSRHAPPTLAREARKFERQSATGDTPSRSLLLGCCRFVSAEIWWPCSTYVKPLIYVALFGPPLLSRVQICAQQAGHEILLLQACRQAPQGPGWGRHLAAAGVRLQAWVRPARKVRHRVIGQLAHCGLACESILRCCSGEQQQGSQARPGCLERHHKSSAGLSRGRPSCMASLGTSSLTYKRPVDPTGDARRGFHAPCSEGGKLHACQFLDGWAEFGARQRTAHAHGARTPKNTVNWSSNWGAEPRT